MEGKLKIGDCFIYRESRSFTASKITRERTSKNFRRLDNLLSSEQFSTVCCYYDEHNTKYYGMDRN